MNYTKEQIKEFEDFIIKNKFSVLDTVYIVEEASMFNKKEPFVFDLKVIKEIRTEETEAECKNNFYATFVFKDDSEVRDEDIYNICQNKNEAIKRAEILCNSFIKHQHSLVDEKMEELKDA